jgi:hypothetical protein
MSEMIMAAKSKNKIKPKLGNRLSRVDGMFAQAMLWVAGLTEN